jgi:hypothetical protein
MVVAELVRHLARMPQDLTVIVSYDSGHCQVDDLAVWLEPEEANGDMDARPARVVVDTEGWRLHGEDG